jgi:hypothetical protein
MDITKEKELRVFEQGKWSIRKDQLVIEATLKIS